MSSRFVSMIFSATPLMMRNGAFRESVTFSGESFGEDGVTSNTLDSVKESINILNMVFTNVIKKSVRSNGGQAGVRTFIIPNTQVNFDCNDEVLDFCMHVAKKISVSNVPGSRGRRTVALVQDGNDLVVYVSSVVVYNENYATSDVYSDDSDIYDILFECFDEEF